MGTVLGILGAFILGTLVGSIGGVFIMKRIIKKKVEKGLGDVAKGAMAYFKDKLQEKSLIEDIGEKSQGFYIDQER